MSIFSSLKRDQKEAIGLLQVGTFLEYFDLMLYVHMAVLLNELFFPKTDPHTASLLAAFAFCSTFILRPFGALIFGYIGDNIGRKTTVIITTMMMSISCIIMANLPTYAQIGITATWVVTICRIIQGLSSMGEVMGAVIYITEITKPPIQYPAVGLISVTTSVGALVALAVSVLATTKGFNWRFAFWIGAAIAVIGTIARTKLRETPEFVDFKRKKQIELEQKGLSKTKTESEIQKIKSFFIEKNKENLNMRMLVAFFFSYCGWPLCFYLSFMYFNPFLKDIYNYSSEDIIFHNFLLSIILLFSELFWTCLSYKIYPLKILKFRGTIFILITVLFPLLIPLINHSSYIFLLQTILLCLPLTANPAEAILIKSVPVFRRFTAVSFIYAITRALMYVITSFGLVYLTKWFSHYGVWIISLPISIGYLWGVNYFEKLEKIKNITKQHLSVSSTISSA